MQLLESSINRVVEISGIRYHIDMGLKWVDVGQSDASTETKIKVKVGMDGGMSDRFCIDINAQNLGDMATLFAEIQRVIGVVAGGAYHTPVPMAAAPSAMAPPSQLFQR